MDDVPAKLGQENILRMVRHSEDGETQTQGIYCQYSVIFI